MVAASVFTTDNMIHRTALTMVGGLSTDQIDSIYEATAEVPGLATTFSLASDVETEGFTDSLLETLQDDAAQERLLAAFKEDPGLVDQINTIIARDPNEFTEILPQIAEPDADIQAVLQGRTTPEEVTAQVDATKAAAENDTGILGGMLNDFDLGDFDLAEFGGNIMEMFLKCLVGLQDMLAPMMDNIIGSLSGLAGGGAVMMAGNSHPITGQSAQALEVAGADNVQRIDQDGKPVTPEATAPRPGDHHPDPVKQPGVDPALNAGA